MKVIHVITDLETGGAEIMLYKLLHSLRNNAIESLVISLMERGAITEQIEALGVKVETLGLGQGEYPGWHAIKKLKHIVRAFNPDILQGWMYHGNIATTVAVFLLGPMRRTVRLFWNVRQTLYDIDSEKTQTRWLIVLGRWLSFFPHSIIYNSNLSAEQHCNFGYLSKKTKIIPNGFNLQKFRPDKNRRKIFRKELDVSEYTILVGHISRFHPMKDHATLLRAIKHVVEDLSDIDSKQEVLFLLTGHGVTSELSNNKAIRFLGERSDIPKIMSALDIVISSSSWGEGFPNIIGESMASEVPCVVTDVGDSAYIVGKYGRVCPVGDDQCIADSLMRLIENIEERKTMGRKARQRIKDNYSINRIKREYLKEWGF